MDVKVSAPSAADPSIITTYVSTPANFQVTSSAAGDIAQIFPNPFNLLTEQVNIVVSNTGGASRLAAHAPRPAMLSTTLRVSEASFARSM